MEGGIMEERGNGRENPEVGKNGRNGGRKQ